MYTVQVIDARNGSFIRNASPEESARFDASQAHPLFRAGKSLAFSRAIRISETETLNGWNGPGIQNGT